MKKKLKKKKSFWIAIGLFLLLVLLLVCGSLQDNEKPSENKFSDYGKENIQESEKEKEDMPTQKLKEVNEENDKEHIAGAPLFPIEGAEEHILPVTGLWIYKIHEKIETFVERYLPESSQATYLSAAPSAELPSTVVFYFELDDKSKTLLEAEYNGKSKDVSVRECTKYTKKEIMEEVWNEEGVPSVTNIP